MVFIHKLSSNAEEIKYFYRLLLNKTLLHCKRGNIVVYPTQ
jgi:hypothetical protein